MRAKHAARESPRLCGPAGAGSFWGGCNDFGAAVRWLPLAHPPLRDGRGEAAFVQKTLRKTETEKERPLMLTVHLARMRVTNDNLLRWAACRNRHRLSPPSPNPPPSPHYPVSNMKASRTLLTVSPGRRAQEAA